MPDVMLREVSPLASVSAFTADGIRIAEEGGFALTQVSGFGKAFEKDLAGVIGKLPAKVGVAQVNDVCTVMRVAPQQYWCVGTAALPELPSSCLVTPLSSARCRIKVEGEKARAVREASKLEALGTTPRTPRLRPLSIPDAARVEAK